MVWVFIVIGFVLGTVLGSLSKALADRSTKKVSFWGRSYCESCKHQLKWHDLFPVFSYLLLWGKCRYCQAKIPLSNLIFEIVMGVLFAWLLAERFTHSFENLAFGWPAVLLFLTVGFLCFVIVVSVILLWTDIKTGLIPDRITYPAIVIGAAYLFISSLLKSWIFYQDLQANPLGPYLLPPKSNYFYDVVMRIWTNNLGNIAAAIIATGIFVLLIVITKGKGMGWGDVKYVFFMGLVLGLSQTAVALFLAFLIGAVFSILLILVRRRSFGQTIPFGPFLSLGVITSLLWGSQILNWYLSSFNLGY